LTSDVRSYRVEKIDKFARAEELVTSFADDVVHLFSTGQIGCMSGQDVQLDDYTYMSDSSGDASFADHANARHVYARLTGTETPRMPPGGPFFPPAKLQTFDDWMQEGFLP
jgi:hypothetical protein